MTHVEEESTRLGIGSFPSPPLRSVLASVFNESHGVTYTCCMLGAVAVADEVMPLGALGTYGM